MGYSQGWVEKVLLGPVKGYARILAGGGDRNRSGAGTKTSRRHKRLVGKSTWFQMKDKERDEEIGEGAAKIARGEDQGDKRLPMRQFSNILFIPHTRGGMLKKSIQE